MDPRSPYLHHNRYASHPHPHPHPQPQPQLQPHPRSHNNFPASHHSSLPSASPLPLRPPPPPPQTQFHHAPSHPQFGFNSNNINYSYHRSHPDVPNFTQSPRVLQQKPFNNDLSRRLQDNIRDNRVDSRESPRVSDRWPPERPYSSANLNSESYRRQLVPQAVSPINTRPGFEGNSRFLEERNVNMIRQGEEFLVRRGDDNYRRRYQFGSDSERSSRDPRTVSNQMNHGSSFESSRGFLFDNRVSENQRRAHDREVTADLRDSFIDRGSHEVSASERVQISGKRENYRNREELERHNGKGSREGSFEYNRTPRKQPQKKSALLRLQKPNNRNREEERAQLYFDDSKSTAFRVKDPNPYPDRGMEQKVRQGSCVELDVSFKSNSLVAKAIVTPSSSAPVSDVDAAPRSWKIRKVLFLNKDSSSPSVKSSEQTEKLGSAISVANDISSSDVGRKELKGKVTASNVTSVSASRWIKVSPGKSRMQNSVKSMVSKKDGTDVSVAKTSFKIAKKKKIVNRVIKKVVNPNLSSSSSQSYKKCEGTIIPDGLAHGLPDSSKPEKDVAIGSANDFDSQLCSNEISLMPQNDKVAEICDAAASEIGAGACSGRLRLPNVKRKRSGSTSPISSSSHEETQINESKLKAHVADFMHVISNIDKDNKLPKENVCTEVDDTEDVDKRQNQRDDSSLLEKIEARKSPSMLLQSEDADCGSSSQEKIEIGQPSSYGMVSGYGTDHGLINSREGDTVSENGVMDSGCKEHRLDHDSPSVENGNQDKISNANCIGNSIVVEQSNSGDTTRQKFDTNPFCSIEGVRTVSGSDNSHTLSEESHEITNAKQLSPERVGMPVDDVYARGSLNFVVSTGVSEEDASNGKMSEENVETSIGDFLKSDVNESCLGSGDMVLPTRWVDTTLRLSFKDCTNCGGDDGVQTCTDVVTVFPQESSNDVLDDFIARTKQKQGKLSGSELKLSCMITSDVNERPIITDISVSSIEAPSSSGCSLTGQDAEAREAAMNPFNIADQIASLPNCSGGVCPSTVDSVRDSFDNDDVRSVHSSSTTDELAVSKVQSPNPSGLEADQIVDVDTVLEGSSHQINPICLESTEGEKMDVDAAEGKLVFDHVTGQCEVPSEIQSLKLDERLLATIVENEICHHVRNDSSSESKYLSPASDGDGVSVANSNIEVLGLVPGTLPDTDYIEASADVPSTLDNQISIEKVGSVDEILVQPAVQGCSNMSPPSSEPLNADIIVNSDRAVEKAHPFSMKTGTLTPMDYKNGSLTLNAARETYGRKNLPAQAVSRVSGSSSLALTTSKKAVFSTPPSKPRSWHRTDNVSASASSGSKAAPIIIPRQKQVSRNVSKLQSTSYIRKGNSLVRKPAAAAAQSPGPHNSNSLGTDEAKKNTGMNNRTCATEPSNFGGKTVGVSLEMPRTPPLPTAKPNHSSGSLGDCMASLAADSVNNFAGEPSSGAIVVAESNDVIKSSEDALKGTENPTREIGQISISDSHNDLNDRNMMSSNANSITYVKRKSNQLIATSNPHLLTNNSNNTLAAPSDGYYKRRKHQLIRTSLEGQVDGSVNSVEQALSNSAYSKSSTRRQFRKVLTKTRKPLEPSLVWTLRSSQLSNCNGCLVHHKKIWPQLFPWKRATYLKNSVPSVATSLISSSSSTMSRKLLLSRKRDTVYTRSKHGFSLRKSKVLSVGGSSLKWSKSIERRSKKANEEATLAVAEAGRKKREQSGASHFASGTKNSNSRKAVHNIKLHAGERIFRIGSVSYKMDSSRRTLQRVSDDDSPYPAARENEKGAKISYVPRRLVIGKDEYVRIGNGNQLVRDPKRRTRILASEKVRWSLHTARSRLARKRKYCQFYTRFGKCNKDDGKCHYIHDSSKIAVCTKFLNGLCSKADCNLTHKVIPERMPDCSFFLQGICSNKNCPYRHVHVNPNASTCEGFLRGYCADGDECRKKHSYVCPTYEATGSCPQGSKCKLHHPKNRTKAKRSKQLRDKKNGQGRYFRSAIVPEPGITVTSGKCPVHDNSYILFEGNTADYISLDFNEEAEKTSNLVDEEMYISDGDPMDFQLDGLDDLIKPIRIMNC